MSEGKIGIRAKERTGKLEECYITSIEWNKDIKSWKDLIIFTDFLLDEKKGQEEPVEIVSREIYDRLKESGHLKLNLDPGRIGRILSDSKQFYGVAKYSRYTKYKTVHWRRKRADE